MFDDLINNVLYDVKNDSLKSNAIMLHIFDTDFNRQGIIENYISMVWEEEYQGRGAFMLVCVDSDENIALLKQNWYVCRKEKQTAMVIKFIKYDSAAHQIIIHGYTTTELINRRVVYPTIMVYNTESGMYKIVNDNKRDMPYLYTQTVKNLPNNFTTQFTGTNVLDAEIALAKQAEYGFFTQFDYRNKKHIFTVYQGIDKTYGNMVNEPVLFSQELKNLNNMIIVDDMTQFKNFAYVGGGGEGADRTWITVDMSGGQMKYELYVDAKDLQKKEETQSEYEQLLAARGVERLNEFNRKQTFIAEVDPLKFGIDYYLGDKITCKSKKYNTQINTRIMHYAEVRENNKTMLKLTLGEPELNLFRR